MSGLGQTFTSPVSGAPLFGQSSYSCTTKSITPTQQARGELFLHKQVADGTYT
jgi:hypothetical protein